MTVANGPGCLNAWMDFTNDSGATPPAADGNFTKAGGPDTYSTYSEHIVQNTAGEHRDDRRSMSPLPPGALGANGATSASASARRDGSNTCTTAVAPTGFVAGGEVEDYRIIPADLSVTKTDGKTDHRSRSDIVYTLTIKNNGSGTATGVTLVDTIGANLSYQSSTCGTRHRSAGRPTPGHLADLAPGASTSCTVTVTVAGRRPG